MELIGGMSAMRVFATVAAAMVMLLAVIPTTNFVSAYLVTVTFCSDSACTQDCNSIAIENGDCVDTGTANTWASQSCVSQSSDSAWTGRLYFGGCAIILASPTGVDSTTCAVVSSSYGMYAKVDCGGALPVPSSSATNMPPVVGGEFDNSSDTGAAASAGDSTDASTGESTDATAVAAASSSGDLSSSAAVALVSSSAVSAPLDCISRTVKVCQGGTSCSDPGECATLSGPTETCQVNDIYFNKLSCDAPTMLRTGWSKHTSLVVLELKFCKWKGLASHALHKRPSRVRSM